MEIAKNNKRVIIAGGGIGGLALALTLHQIGIQCIVFESVRQIQPLGVGINIQPNAVRELFELGIGPEVLDQVGIQAQEWALVGLNGKDIYAEPRGLKAGYRWPQYAAHRGKLHVLLFETVIARLGESSVRLGQRITGYEKHADGTVSAIIEHANGDITREQGDLLIGADGIHSSVRAQMHPDQPPIHCGTHRRQFDRVAEKWLVQTRRDFRIRFVFRGIPIRLAGCARSFGAGRYRL